ncbi:hypothetical protein EDC01DRAFT_660756 [Geopyxis carbonaria]|nr:hypothetical protein EDC01DRAFT_660756 [Geopyxis carbonaria]
MSSSAQAPANISGKSSNSITASIVPQVQQPLGSSVAGNDPQRRSGGGGGSSAGAGTANRGISTAPRNNQNSRKGHRNHRRPNAHYSDEEQVAMTSSSRKGTSITHLINWNVAAPRPQSYNEFRPRNSRRAPTWGLGSGYHAEDKARYINSNYRFIVNPRGDYRAQAIDSDIHLPWDHVLQVLASERTQCPNCPICLSAPVAPRMAKCGHIFCLPCLVRYMASYEGDRPPEKKQRYKKCVICTDSVYMNDIRPVRFVVGQEGEPPKVGGDVVLRLIMRKQGSTLALPKDGADQPSKLDKIPWYFAAEVMDYARVMKGTEDYMMAEFEREIQEVDLMEKEDELMFGEENDWSRKAISMIRIQMEGLKGIGNPPRPTSELQEPKKKAKEERPPIEFLPHDEAPEMYHVQHEARSGHSSELPTPPVSVESAVIPEKQISANELSSTLARAKLNPEPSHDGAYFFYQALLHYYLSPLDIRILKDAFGSFASFPSTVLPRVENVTTGHIVDDDLRKRAKYLAHLPYGCEVGFLECDWTDIVPREILAKYRTDIERRRKHKRDKELKEERDRIRSEKLDDEQRWASARQRRRDSIKEEFRQEDFVALTSPDPASEQDGGEAEEWRGGQESAFASLGSPSTSPAHSRTVWGTPAISTGEEHIYNGYEDNHSGWRTDWEKELQLGDDMMAQIAMEESMANDSTGGGGGHAPSHGKGQKKKKFKKVTLMTNGGKRGA